MDQVLVLSSVVFVENVCLVRNNLFFYRFIMGCTYNVLIYMFCACLFQIYVIDKLKRFEEMTSFF